MNKCAQDRRIFVQLVFLVLVIMLVFLTFCEKGYSWFTKKQSTTQAEQSLPGLISVMNNVETETKETLFIDENAIIEGFPTIWQNRPEKECKPEQRGKNPKGCICVCQASKGCIADGIVKCSNLDFDIEYFILQDNKKDDNQIRKTECKIKKTDGKLSLLPSECT